MVSLGVLLHDKTVELANEFFNRWLDRADKSPLSGLRASCCKTTGYSESLPSESAAPISPVSSLRSPIFLRSKQTLS